MKKSIPFSDNLGRSEGTHKPPVRAMWVWNIDPLLFSQNYRAEFFAFCEEKDINEIFLQVPYKFINDLTDDVECKILHQTELHAFIKKARQKGIKSHALDGSPEFVLTQYHPRVLAQVRALIDFNKNASQAEQFYGIHLDNEPYQLLGFNGPAGRSIILQFFDLNQKVMDLLRREKSEMVYGIDIPFWFDEAKDNEGNLKYVFDYNGKIQDAARHLIDIVDNVGIMNYRNFAGGEDGMVKHGQDEVWYADKVGKKVYLGVETFEYDPANVSFIYVPPERKGISQHAERELLEMTSTINGLKVRSIETPNLSLVGVSHSRDLSDHPNLNSALFKLFDGFWVRGYEKQTDLGDFESLAREVIEEDNTYDGFSPFLLEKTDHKVFVAGFNTTEKMLSKITFAGRTKSEMEEVLDEVSNAFQGVESFLGFAIHYYQTYKALAN